MPRNQIMARPSSSLLLTCVFLALTGCDRGYTKKGEKWTYIVINEAVGKEVRELDVDPHSFVVFPDSEYAKDNKHAFHCGRQLEGVDGATFELLGELGFSKDARQVFYRNHVIVGADPGSFRLLEFPYARDDDHVYCGSLRMVIENADKFRVLSNGDPSTTSYFHSTEDLVKHFGEQYSEHVVLWAAEKQNHQFVVASSFSGEATDGTWNYEGPKRIAK
jgi:hypothetical protein